MTGRMTFEPVIAALARLATDQNVRIMVVGATARDLALAREGQDAALRATEDVDIAVAVGGYDAFEAVTAGLDRVAASRHKFRMLGVEVDVVPYGEIESEDRTVTWPDGTVMNTLGLAEAFGSATVLDLGDGLSIRVATLAAQAALKVIAWSDRSSWTQRDAADLGTIIRAYSLRNRLDEVYSPLNQDLMIRYGYDVVPTGAHVLGREIRETMGTQVAESASSIVRSDLHESARLPVALRLEHPDPALLLDAFGTGLDGE